jgi:deazaflavin-dependent oxidoreductase (nitroreductase family)
MAKVPTDEEFIVYNRGVIAEFRANRGVVTQPAFPVLLLTTTGARTGRRSTVPVGYAVDDDGRVFVVASKAGAPKHPAWFHNLKANPLVEVELGERTFEARAVEMTGEERDRLFRRVAGEENGYHRITERVFPVVVLEGVTVPG